MFLALTWSGVFALIALWSLAAWAFHEAGAWVIANTGVFTGGAIAVDSLRLPVWIEPWVPSELLPALASMLTAFGPAIEGLLAWVPGVLGGLTLAVWVIWAAGSTLLIILGLLLSVLIRLLRRARSGSAIEPAAARMAR